MPFLSEDARKSGTEDSYQINNQTKNNTPGERNPTKYELEFQF